MSLSCVRHCSASLVYRNAVAAHDARPACHSALGVVIDDEDDGDVDDTEDDDDGSGDDVNHKC